MITEKFIAIKHYFTSPISFYSRPWIIILLNVILSAMMLVLYEPFGYKLHNWKQFGELVGFTVITLFYSFLFFYCLPKYMQYRNLFSQWNIARHICYLVIFLIITGINIFLYDFHFISSYSIADYGGKYFTERLITDVFGVFAIGIFPLYIGYLLDKNHLLYQQHIDESIYDSEKVSQKTNETTTNHSNTIVLKGETKEILNISPENIIYIESSGNYVNIYYWENKTTRKTIRATIKKIEEQLQTYEYFTRCHRAYIINIKFIDKFGRNTQGYRICLKHYSGEIPVSRTYINHIKDTLHLS
ncbi:MAG: LytTR family DNA-binding domain-containing protein [Parabacteroides sp.]|nr:LytTR family DNA-binding domain-containing protein [Parabacteroides sp.]